MTQFYAVFSFPASMGAGGWNDLVGQYATFEEATAAALAATDEIVEIVELPSGRRWEVVESGDTRRAEPFSGEPPY